MFDSTTNGGPIVTACTLTTVMEAVGAPTLWPWLVPPSRVDRNVSDVVIHDHEQPEPLDPGAIVLAVGLDTSGIDDLLRIASEADVAAVVVRARHGAKDALLAAAERADVALLALAPGVSWTRIQTLLRNAMSTTGVHAAEEGVDLTHNELTTVANSLASIINGSVVIFNPQQDILAASRLDPDDDAMRHQAVSDQHGPVAYRERLRELGVYKRLWSSDEVVSVPAIPELGAGRRKAIMVRAGDEILGSIWVASKGELAPDADAILRSAAATASGHLVWLQARALSQRRFNEGVLQQLLSGDADIATAAGWLGVQADQPCSVLIAWTPDPLNRRRLSNLLSMHFSAYRHTTMSVVARSTVELVFCDLGKPGIGLDVARDLVTRAAHSMNQPVLAAVGPTGDSLDDLPRSHRDADAALRVLRRRAAAGETRVAGFAELRSAIQVDRVHQLIAEDAGLLDGHAQTLLQWDEERGTYLAESLRAYLEAFGNVADAAERSHVHPNTLRYRVRKACGIAGLDLADPDQRLMAQLHLSRAGRLS